MVNLTDQYYLLMILCKIIISCLFKNIKIIQKKKYIMLDISGKNFSILQIANIVKKIFKCPVVVFLNNPSHDERSYKVNFDLLSKDFFDVIDFKNKDIFLDIKKLKLFFKKK